MDLLSFIRTADPTKVRVAERQHVENEPRLLESTFGRTDIQPIVATTDTIVEDVAPLQPRRQRKRKTIVVDASGHSHPPKKLREDYGALGGPSTTGKSRSAVQSLFTEAVLNAEAKGEPIPTLPFVTSLVSATPKCEDKSPADFVIGLNLRTIGAPQRFVISSDSTPAIAIVTTVTAAVDADTTADRVPVLPSLFGVGSSSSGRTDSVPGGFSDVSGSDFLIGGIRTVVDPDSDLQKVYVPQWSATNGFGLDDSQAAEAIRLWAEVFKLEAAEKSFQGEVGVLKDHSATLEREKNELSVKVTDLLASVKIRDQEVADLDVQVTAINLHNDNLVDQVHELEISSVGLQEKVDAYEYFIGQLKEFQDKKYMRCLNSTKYLSALGAAISKSVEKGMQEGLYAGIIYGAEDRK
nr:hypothetical protein [Tanacetum cinerariifolium]